MRFIFFIFVLFIISSCAKNEVVYWCGDHPCANNKERIAYFKKTMIVEIRDSSKKDIAKNKELNKQKKDEIKKMKRQAKINKKKEEKELKKQLKLETKAKKKKDKKINIAKKSDINEKKITQKISLAETGEFDEIYKTVMKTGINKSYPDINEIRE